MVDKNTAPAETDFSKAILQIADANNIIKEKTATIQSLEAKEALLVSELPRYETSLAEIKQEVEKERNSLETILKAKDEAQKHDDEYHKVRMAEVDAREKDIITREEAIKESELSIERNRAESQKIIEDNTKAQAEVDSKLDEAKHLSSGRKEEMAQLESKRQECEIAMAKLEVQRAEIAQESATYTELYNNVKASQQDAQALHDSIQKDRETAEAKINEARTENNSAEYNKGMATLLTASFRQALHTYCQLSGTAIQIPELTNEHKLWIAEDLIKQTQE